MTTEQMERLPGLLREIVLLDRRMADLRAAPVTSISEWSDASSTRKRLSVAAMRRYGPLGGGRTGQATA